MRRFQQNDGSAEGPSVEVPYSYLYDTVLTSILYGESVSVDTDSEFVLEALSFSWSGMTANPEGFTLKLQDGNGNYLSNRRIGTRVWGGGSAPLLLSRSVVYPPGSRITFDIEPITDPGQVQIEFRGYKRMLQAVTA